MPPTNRDLLVTPSTGTPHGLSQLSTSRQMSLLDEAPAIARSLLDSGDVDDRIDVTTAIQNISAILAKALVEHDDALFERGIQSLASIWALGDSNAMLPNRTPAREASLWETITVELYALGAIALRHERWAQLREIALQHPDPAYGHDRSWLRQGQVASARSTDYPEDTVVRLGCKRVAALDAEPSTDAEALTYVCQFDLIVGLIISETDPKGFYVNAAEFSEDLVEPLVIERLRRPSGGLRQYVFPGDQDGLRKALLAYDHMARGQAAQARYRGGSWQWRGFSDARTFTFMDEGHLLEEWIL